mmetsp:Transcript_34486/g.86993  ORF Transcript_34486/g.86993 Transcript_34486/m.86993 type:complete len:202 (+) Transcript_34486:501-1106(+)
MLLNHLIANNLCDAAEALQHRLVCLVVAMAEVEPDAVHARLEQICDGRLVPALGAHGAHDLGLPHDVRVLLVVHQRVQAHLGGAVENGAVAWVERARHDDLARLGAQHKHAERQALRVVVVALRAAGHKDHLIAVLDLDAQHLAIGLHLRDSLNGLGHGLVRQHAVGSVPGAALLRDLGVLGAHKHGDAGLVLGHQRGGAA